MFFPLDICKMFSSLLVLGNIIMLYISVLLFMVIHHEIDFHFGSVGLKLLSNLEKN